MNKHVIIYSHGFGVKKDDRGLFTDIATALPDAEHVMFDYNKFDEENNTLTASPLFSQVKMLTDVYEKTKNDYPDAIIDLICHSQGCVVAGLAGLSARKTILLAPPIQTFTAEDKFRNYLERNPKTVVCDDGAMVMPRRDGSTTLIGQDYWRDYNELPDIPSLYNELADVTDLTVIDATEDEVLGEKSYSNLLDKIRIIEIDGADHNFKGGFRQEMIKALKGVR